MGGFATRGDYGKSYAYCNEKFLREFSGPMSWFDANTYAKNVCQTTPTRTPQPMPEVVSQTTVVNVTASPAQTAISDSELLDSLNAITDELDTNSILPAITINLPPDMFGTQQAAPVVIPPRESPFKTDYTKYALPAAVVVAAFLFLRNRN